MRKRVISTLLAMATTAGLFAGNVSAVYAEGKSSGDYEYQELEDAEITYYNYSVEGKEEKNCMRRKSLLTMKFIRT